MSIRETRTRILATHEDWEAWRQERYAENRLKAQAALALLARKSGATLTPTAIDTLVTSLSDPQLTILLCQTTSPDQYLQICFWTDAGVLSTARLLPNFPLTSSPITTTSDSDKCVVLPDENATTLNVHQTDQALTTHKVGHRRYSVYSAGFRPKDTKPYRHSDPTRFALKTDEEVASDIRDGFLNAENEAIVSFVNRNYPPSLQVATN